MESMEAITATVDIHVLINLTRILNELIEMIENGKLNQEVGVLMFGAVKDTLMNFICVKQNAHILK